MVKYSIEQLHKIIESTEDVIESHKRQLEEAQIKKKRFQNELDLALMEAKKIPVDRSNISFSDGSPVTSDYKPEITDSGQQKLYIVLSEDERQKGFVRPYRDSYMHLKCKTVTAMSKSIAETYARDPSFYNSTFCSHCRTHFPIGEKGDFIWIEMDGNIGPRVGT